MTTIDELEAMDFVDWEAAAPSTSFEIANGTERGPTEPPVGGLSSAEDPNMDLVFGNIDGDDWSFWALEHFESTHTIPPTDLDLPPEDPGPAQDMMITAADSQMYWEIPEAPCAHCSGGNYSCKRIREGKYKGYCTTCVALRCECSFGPALNSAPAEAGATFPANPWPIMGDRPNATILLEDDLSAIIHPDPGLTAVVEDQNKPAAMEELSQPALPNPKIGARFSRESVKVLKNWVSTHSKHPYPTEEEKESLQKITGLNKTQITNWLANARRRGKIHTTRATSPHIGRGYAQAMDITQRRGTPSPFEEMNPLQRWANSPPENEPASVTAIARAVSASGSYSQSSSGRNSPYISNYSDDGSRSSWCNQSSASSLGTSHSSGGSFASAFSHKSHGSLGSVPSFVRGRARRRRRRAPPKRAEPNMSLTQPLKTFQCTFCTETFRTKHDWQRHEKSLHLSLERWVCSPDGPRVVHADTGATSCVFCGENNPTDDHIESHNFSGCLERTPEERTFYRKDHLRQHLKLVHNVKYLAGTMDKWRAASPEIRSRCGFCGIVLDSWTTRVDHLAEHFKTGYSMADWKGDWGFEEPVLEMVENSIPPYLIDDERKSPLPFQASTYPPTTPSNAFDLLKVELLNWVGVRIEENGQPPSDDEVQHEACRILFGAEVLSYKHSTHSSTSTSWLRDLIMSSSDIVRSARFHPIRSQADSHLNSLHINGKRDIFEDCDLERQLHEFVQARQSLGLTAIDHELQVEACRIIGRIEEKSTSPSEELANWLVRLVHRSPEWLEGFRERAHLPRSDAMADVDRRPKDPKSIDSTIHNYSRLERELGEYYQSQRAMGLEPTDADLQRQARIIIYDIDDEWNQTAADDREWLLHFRQRHPMRHVGSTTSRSSPSTVSGRVLPQSAADGISQPAPENLLGQQQRLFAEAAAATPSSSSSNTFSMPSHKMKAIRAGPCFLNDANCYRRLARGLSRFVASTMSANNPNSHVPTDKELQHQARWIIYDDDDPWNQTAADNMEWLQRFKRDVGILPEQSGPGLPLNETSWLPSAGGSGFAPPYVFPNPASSFEPLETCPVVGGGSYNHHPRAPSPSPHRGRRSSSVHSFSGGAPLSSSQTSFSQHGGPYFEPDASTATHFLQNMTQRYPAPAKVFCSRELETGLTEYVRRELTRPGGGRFPDDEELRQRARDIMSMQKTPCDDPVLLSKFKATVMTAGAGAGPVLAPDMFSSSDFSVPLDASDLMPPPAAPTPIRPSRQSGITTGLAALGQIPLPDVPDASKETSALPTEGETGLDMDFVFTEQDMRDILQDVSPDGLGLGGNEQASGTTSADSARLDRTGSDMDAFFY